MSIKLGLLASSQQQAAPLLLDAYPGAAAAYSLRKLRTAYTGAAIRVRRSSDNTQTDIGFNGSGELDTTTLSTFCGLGNGFVVTWYDQSGNNNHAVQTVGSSQPLIVFNGALFTENNKPVIIFNGYFLAIPNGIIADTNISIFAAQRVKDAGQYNAVLGANAQGPYFGSDSANKYYLQLSVNGQFKGGSSATVIGTSYNVLNTIVNSTNAFSYVNDIFISVTLNNSSAPNIFNTIGKYWFVASNLVISEIIIYKTDQSSNKTQISNNIKSFYTII